MSRCQGRLGVLMFPYRLHPLSRPHRLPYHPHPYPPHPMAASEGVLTHSIFIHVIYSHSFTHICTQQSHSLVIHTYTYMTYFYLLVYLSTYAYVLYIHFNFHSYVHVYICSKPRLSTSTLSLISFQLISPLTPIHFHTLSRLHLTTLLAPYTCLL